LSIRQPDRHGVWSAWRVPIEPLTVDQRGTLDLWLLHCPGAHAAWSYWGLSLLHLRPLKGESRPAFKQYPDAEYEVLSVALDPDYPPNPDDAKTFRALHPIDFALQFHGIGDVNAISMIEKFVELVVAGRLSPDTDYRSRWQELIWGSVEHLTTGHPVGSA